MRLFLGFGSGANGVLNQSSPAILSPIVASASATGGTKTISATNASFAAGQMILIVQTVGGANVGKAEINFIQSYVAGTISTVFDLENTYTDSGAQQAQVFVVPQYSQITLSSTLTGTSWDGNINGVMALACSGKMLITSAGLLKINGSNGSTGTDGVAGATGGGFRGAAGRRSNGGITANQGEGSAGTGSASTAANGNGGGGASKNSGFPNVRAGGGGGGNGTAGGSGGNTGSATGGTAGTLVGTADLNPGLYLGGGGGGGASGESENTGSGGSGGGIIVLIVNELEIQTGGGIQANGGNGGGDGAAANAGGGGGAGGTILIISNRQVLGSNLVTATGGTGGNASSGSPGGSGASGRIRLINCSKSGSTNPTASVSEGGQSFCIAGGPNFI